MLRDSREQEPHRNPISFSPNILGSGFANTTCSSKGGKTTLKPLKPAAERGHSL